MNKWNETFGFKHNYERLGHRSIRRATYFTIVFGFFFVLGVGITPLIERYIP